MAGFVRAKRVTDPLDDKVKARLVGEDRRLLSYVSSGSEHSADDSPCLSELVHGFLEDDSETHESLGYENEYESESESDRVDSVADFTDLMEEVMKSTAANNVDSYRNLLLAHVSKAIDMFSFLTSQRTIFRRKIMTFLRDSGHNAAICKTKWEASGGLTAGNYEFIDVVQSSSSKRQIRYFIDLDFAAEFKIARPKDQYSRLLRSLPEIFVGKSEELKKIVKLMCEAAKRSLKSKDLSLPPWRKNRFMQNKWFGPYHRTTNQIPANSLAPALPPVNAVICRCVGFDDAVNGRLFVRTR